MLIPAGTLVSDCHEAIIYMEGNEYRCVMCVQSCKSAGTLGEVSDRKTVVSREHEYDSESSAMYELTDVLSVACSDHRNAVDTLVEFESEHDIST